MTNKLTTSLPVHRPPEPQEWVSWVVQQVGHRMGGLLVNWGRHGITGDDWMSFGVHLWVEQGTGMVPHQGPSLGLFRVYLSGRDHALVTVLRKDGHAVFMSLEDALLWAAKDRDVEINTIEPLAFIPAVAKGGG
jgi:hypothetical protein